MVCALIEVDLSIPKKVDIFENNEFYKLWGVAVQNIHIVLSGYSRY